MLVRAVIKKLGGTSATAQRFKITRQAVEHWMKIGLFPVELLLPIADAAGTHCTLLDPVIYPPNRFSTVR